MFRTLLSRKQKPVVAVRDSDVQCLPEIGRQGNAGRQAASPPSMQAVGLMVVATCGQYEDVLEHAKFPMQHIATDN